MLGEFRAEIVLLLVWVSISNGCWNLLHRGQRVFEAEEKGSALVADLAYQYS